jgi:hypothetical protein
MSRAADATAEPCRCDDWVGARLQRPGSPLHLAFVRVVFALHALSVLTSPALPLSRRLTDRPLSLTHTLVPASIERWLVARDHLDLVIAVGVIAALCVVIGLLTRVTLWLLFAAFVLTQNYFFRHSLFHDDWLYVDFYLLVLCVSPCADRLAVDRLLRPTPARARNAYRWPVEVMVAWFALVYVSAAVAKLLPLPRGLWWLSGGSLQHFAVRFLFDSPIYWVLGRPLFDYSLRWPFCIGATACVLVELSAILLLLTRRFDRPVVLAIIAMHVVIALIGVPGFVQIALVSSVLFLRPRP